MLWIESLPYWETRYYVPAIMRNMWVYQGSKAPPNRASSRSPSTSGRPSPQSAASPYRSCFVLTADASCAHAGRVDQRARGNPQQHADALQPQGAADRRRLARPGRGARRRAEAPDHGDDRKAQVDPHPQQLARHRLRPLDQRLSRLRAWLHLLLRPADPRLSRSVARARFRIAGCSPSRTRRKLLTRRLARPGYESAPIAMGTNTDPYQPIEERWRITRSVLEVLLETRHPLTITTKSDRVLRDLDLLGAGGGAGHRLGRHFGDLARPGDFAHAGAARAGGRASASRRSRR